MNLNLFEPIARTNANWDPFHEFFLWLARNNTDWCVTAGNYYEEMLLGTGYCPGSGHGPVSKDFCTDFVNAYVSKCVKEDSAQLDDQAMVAVFVLALACALFTGFISKRTFVLPESPVCIIIGFVFGTVIYATAKQNTAPPSFEPSIFFLILVPPIALQSLLEINPRTFCRNFPTIMWLAILNTVLTCVSVGFLIYFWYSEELSMPTCLLMGAISSSVDPTAVRVALEERMAELESAPCNHARDAAAAFDGQREEKESREGYGSTQGQPTAPPRSNLHMLRRLRDLDATIFGESSLNDGVSFVLYSSLLPLVVGTSTLVSPTTTPSSSSRMNPLEKTGAECIVDFFYTYTISFAIGIMTGLVSALIFKCFVNPCNLREKKDKRRGMVVYIALSLLPYFLCTLFDLSGLVGLCGSTCVMLNFTNYSLTDDQRSGVCHILGTWSKLTEYFIFSYVGFCIASPFQPPSAIVSDVKFTFDSKLIAITIGACLLSRGWIIVLGALTNVLRKTSVRYELRGLTVMWWSGLRGPVCFALALSVPHYNYVTHVGSKDAPKIAATMTTLVVVSTFFLGGTSNCLLRWLYKPPSSFGAVEEDTLREDQKEHNLIAFAMRTNRGPFRTCMKTMYEKLFIVLVSEPPTVIPPPVQTRPRKRETMFIGQEETPLYQEM